VAESPSNPRRPPQAISREGGVARLDQGAPCERDVLEEIERVAMESGIDPPLDPDAELQRDLALDSLALITLVVSLEDRFQVALSEEDAAEVRTARQLAALVVARRGESP
jgi:acyl carrier protein